MRSSRPAMHSALQCNARPLCHAPAATPSTLLDCSSCWPSRPATLFFTCCFSSSSVCPCNSCSRKISDPIRQYNTISGSTTAIYQRSPDPFPSPTLLLASLATSSQLAPDAPSHLTHFHESFFTRTATLLKGSAVCGRLHWPLPSRPHAGEHGTKQLALGPMFHPPPLH